MTHSALLESLVRGDFGNSMPMAIRCREASIVGEGGRS